MSADTTCMCGRPIEEHLPLGQCPPAVPVGVQPEGECCQDHNRLEQPGERPVVCSSRSYCCNGCPTVAGQWADPELERRYRAATVDAQPEPVEERKPPHWHEDDDQSHSWCPRCIADAPAVPVVHPEPGDRAGMLAEIDTLGPVGMPMLVDAIRAEGGGGWWTKRGWLADEYVAAVRPHTVLYDENDEPTTLAAAVAAVRADIAEDIAGVATVDEDTTWGKRTAADMREAALRIIEASS